MPQNWPSAIESLQQKLEELFVSRPPYPNHHITCYPFLVLIISLLKSLNPHLSPGASCFAFRISCFAGGEGISLRCGALSTDPF